MPEFRLKRNKKDKGERRRHTLHNDSEMSKQLQEVAKHFEDQTEIILGPNEISVDDAMRGIRRTGGGGTGNGLDVFINSTSSSDPPVKALANRRISSKYNECIYLRYGADMRRCPLPSPITLSTIKQLFINLFDLNPSITNDPKWHLFMLNRSNTWKPLNIVNDVTDQCTLLLVDSSDLETSPLPLSTPPLIQRSSTGTPDVDLSSDDEHEDFNVTVQNPIERLQPQVDTKHTTDQPSAPPPIDTGINENAAVVQGSGDTATVDQLHKEISQLKLKHQLEIQALHTELSLARLAVHQGAIVELSQYRKDRLTLEPLKEEYLKESDAALSDMSLLQSIGDALKVDAIHHQSRIDDEEIEYLLTLTEESAGRFVDLKGQYEWLAPRLKDVMQKELEVIVVEEQIIKEEARKLTTATEACKVLKETFTTLKQLSSLQAQKPLQVPVYETCSDPQIDHKQLVANINSIIPNHQERLDAINETEMIMRKRKTDLSPTKRALKKFESDLRKRQKVLNPTGRVMILEKEREEKLRSLYMTEKHERQREIEKDLEIAQKALKEKRRKEISEIEQRLGIDLKLSSRNAGKGKSSQKRKEEEEEKNTFEIKRLEEEKKRLEDERKSQEEERERLDQLRKEQEEQQRRLRDEQRRQEDEQRRIELQRFQQEQERRQIEDDKRQWKEYHLRLGSESPETRTKRKEMLWQHVQRQIQMENEKEEKEKSENALKRRAHTLKDSHFSSSQSNSFEHNHSQSFGHFSEVENVHSLPLAPPVSLSSRSHKDLRHNDEQVRSSDGLSRKHITGSSSTHNGLLQRGGGVGGVASSGLLSDELMPKFSSEDSLIKQHLYDSPWTSKQFLIHSQGGVANRRGSGSQVQHKRNTSETPPIAPKHHHERGTSSPVLVHPLRSTIGKSKSNEFTTRNVTDDTRNRYSPPSHPPPLPPPPVTASRNSPPNNSLAAPPPYSQVAIAPPLSSSMDSKKGSLVSDRMTHYPAGQDLAPPIKYKPSISLV